MRPAKLKFVHAGSLWARRALHGGVCLAALTAALPVTAQTAQPTAGKGVEEVVVTAQKRKEKLQNVPIAVTAVSATDLARAGVSDLADLDKVTPSLQVTQAIGVYAQPVIRSVGTSSHGPGIENPVATYIDGVYLVSAASSLMSLYDIQQVAVLKGPQGTLFGRNATGGLIQITTKVPSHVFSADIEGTIGNLGTYNENVYVNGGITSSLAGNLALSHNVQGQGFGRNLYNGEWVGTFHEEAGRGKLLWQPDGATDVTLSADYSHREGSDIDIRIRGLTETGSPVPGNWWDIDNNVQPQESYHGTGGSVTVKHDFNTTELLSITALRGSKGYSYFDADSTPLPTLSIANTQTDKQFSEELQLLSPSNQRLTWVTGLYFLDAGSDYDPAFTGVDEMIHLEEPYLGSSSGPVQVVSDANEYVHSTVQSYAAFVQTTYKITPSTNLTTGLRYTADFRHIESTTDTNAGGTELYDGYILPSSWAQTEQYSNQKNFAQPSARVSLDHRFSPELLMYVSYNHGFRSGSFDPLTVEQANGTYINPELKPEIIDAFETGAKTNLFNDRLRFDAAAYYYLYQNRQVQTIINGVEYDYSAPRSEIYGIDGDLTANVTNQLSLTGGFSATHAVYTSFPDAFLSSPNSACCGVQGFNPYYEYPVNLVQGSATGKTIENTPFWTLNLTPTYRLPTTVGDFTFTLSYFHNGGWYGDPDDRTKQNAYDTIAADANWVPSFAPQFSIRVWGKNLTNQQYATQIQPTNFGDNYNVAPGRTYGVTLGAHF